MAQVRDKLRLFRYTEARSADRENCIPHRYMLAVLGAIGLLPVVGGRKCFAMVLTHTTSRNTQHQASDLFFSDCHEVNVSNSTPVQMSGDTMFLLHATYFAGSPFLQLPGAIIAARLSPTRVIGCSVLITSVISLMVPLVLQTNTTLLFLLRFMQGAAEGLQQPASVGLLSVWCTDKDRTRLFGIYFTGEAPFLLWHLNLHTSINNVIGGEFTTCTGAYFAPVLASVVTGFTLCYVTWACSLYIYGGFGVLWSVVWLCTIYDTPDLHPSLTTEERFLHQQHGPQRTTRRKTLGSIPWKSLVTSGPVWAVFVGNFCRTFIYSMLVVEQPQFYKDAFNLNAADVSGLVLINSNTSKLIGLVTTLPHVGLSASCAVGGMVSDRLLAWGMSTTTTRKLLYSTGNGVEGLCLLALYLAIDWRAAITLISLGVTIGGYGPLPADMAPEFAGVVAGLCALGTIGAIVNAVLASVMTGMSRSLSDWQTLFLISGLVQLTGVFIFNVIAKAERQPWADYTLHTEEEEKFCRNVGALRNEDELFVSSDLETTPLKSSRQLTKY
ncbi:hypothetical protein BaRGS_00015163 [Batillaria attramentaria]|uniref:Uncharacterized protein n=1 Tax=Batillaria attramentaria TaxID=370345 RepID=A0ABD0L308_9CAEN